MAEISEKLMKDTYTKHMATFDNMRHVDYENFRSFYEKDYEAIKLVIKKYYEDKPYSKGTFEEILIIHHDIIHKTLERLAAGIYDKQQTIVLVSDKENAQEDLQNALDKLDYYQQVKEAFKRSLFFNIIGVEPIFRDKKVDLEVISPDMFAVRTGKNYYNAKSVVLQRTNEDGTIYYTYWDDDRHFIYDSVGNEVSVGNNEEMENPYKELPFSWLRILKGNDFYGEPEWDLFLDQIAIDMKVTDYDLAEAIQRSGILHSHNGNLATGIRLRPNTILQTESKDPNKTVTLNYIKLDTDFTSWKDSIDWRKKATLSNKGIVGASASTDVNTASGVAKTVDEMSLEEKRNSYRLLLNDFEVVLLNKIRIVWNYRAKETGEKLIPEGEFKVIYQEQKPFESQDDKDKRRAYEIKYKIKDPIEIMMEEMEVNEDELIERLKKREERNELLAKEGITVTIEGKQDTLRDKLIAAQQEEVENDTE